MRSELEKQQRREQGARYREKHRDKINKQASEHYHRNKESILARQRAVYKTPDPEICTLKRQTRRQEAIVYLGNKCVECQLSYPNYVYDFHHKDPKEKDFSISEKIMCKPTTFWAEVDKCILLCANCHRIIHNRERQKL